MAPVWITLLFFLPSLLQVSAYIKLSEQGGMGRVAGWLPRGGSSQPASQGQWVWGTARPGSTDVPMFVRAKREVEVKTSSHSTAENSTTSRPSSFSVTPSQHPVEVTQVSSDLEWLDESIAPELLEEFTITAEPAAGSDNVNTQAHRIRAGSHVDTSTKAALTPGSSHAASEAVVTGREETLSGSTESREHGSSTGPPRGKGLAESSSTSPPKNLTESSGISTVPPVEELATSRHRLSTLGKNNSSHWVVPAGGSVTVKDPMQKTHNDTNILVGKCLLAVFILALVAAIFIVCTAVLATLLWRQKHAYNKHQCNATEMVCISALLTDSEPAANGAKPSKIKRMKMPTDNLSETEGDNLTLNSFLPDH
ncbi:P-selectin glycoprotein ligand 1 [Carettochelys insculpta]|uniref:P-selectin glycoprotein ligand 1 n=1 Tax=Carettochelys insculpta TaxID=44489 RepID=UPI003EC072BE